MVFRKKSELFQVFVEIQHFLCSEKSGILPFFTDLHGFALGGDGVVQPARRIICAGERFQRLGQKLLSAIVLLIFEARTEMGFTVSEK